MKDHLEHVRIGAKAWNTWRSNNPGIRPNLGWKDLIEADLRQFDLSGANLRGANLTRATLSGANLRDAELREAELGRADLTAADMSGANLYNARLHDSDLSKALLSGANLRGADLRGANLRGAILLAADLAGAFLIGTDFKGANLKWAHFGGALMESTALSSNDLSETKGLAAVRHRGPSTIGVDTLFKSNGKIPDSFLRGAGLPESLITYLPSLIGRPLEFYSCFISYSHADRSFARRLHDALQGQGIRCWLDEHQLLPGDKIYTEVDRGIRLWDKVLLCCSKDSLVSWWVDNEIKIAFDKEQYLWRERGKEVLTLIPLNLDDYLFSGAWKSGLATEVRSRLAANFTGWEHDNKKFEEQFERLVMSLQTGEEKAPPPPLRL